MGWIALLLGVTAYLILCKVALVDDAKQKHSRWVAIGDARVRPKHAALPEDGRVFLRPTASRCWFVVRNNTYILRCSEPPTQSEVTEALLNWAADDRVGMALADAEALMDYIDAMK